VRLRPATADDIGFVLEAEADSGAAPFIRGGTRAEHEAALTDPSLALLIVVEDDRAAGFVLLAGIGGPDGGIELRRIVVARPGRGLGRRALALVLEHAFAELGAHRVWLDVMTHNERARRAYEAAGFVHEAVRRDALRSSAGYVSLAVMSVLEREFYAGRKQTERT
jgi:RimJ/RimL family protein N-acetyltransferase